jgi:hypothetical protein
VLSWQSNGLLQHLYQEPNPINTPLKHPNYQLWSPHLHNDNNNFDCSNQSPCQILYCPLKMNTGRKQIKYGCGYVYVETVLVIKHGALASQSLLPNVEKKKLVF